MATERTLSILKPDALESGAIGKILTKLEEAGLKPVAMKMLRLTQEEAEGFYAVHRERPFFRSLVKYMTSGPVMLTCLERENAIEMVGFGSRGSHFCLGANLAGREIKVMFEELFDHLPDIEATGDPDMLLSAFIHGIKHLPVRYTPKKPRART